jgi:hypothetical protein
MHEVGLFGFEIHGILHELKVVTISDCGQYTSVIGSQSKPKAGIRLQSIWWEAVKLVGFYGE